MILSLLPVQTLRDVIIIVSSVCSLTAAVDGAAQCTAACTCHRENPTSPLIMNCSAVIKFPVSHLNAMNLSAAVSELDLSNNSLSSVSTSTFHRFVQLESLTLRCNRLAVVEPAAFDGTRLRRLDLSGNQFATVLPGTFRGVESTLVDLDLSHNVLINVDEAFDGLSSLSRLDLRHNLLASLSSRLLRGMNSLRHLRLDSNLIAQVDELSLLDLSRLTNLGLSGNPLSFLTRLNFAVNASLSYIDLSECSLTVVPRGLPDTLNYIQLRRNHISHLYADSFHAASKVRIIVLDENELSEVDSKTFLQLSGLQQLWMNNNRLTRVPQYLPSSLQRLMLDSNDIDRLSADSFPPRSQLNTITMMENAIREIDSGTFQSVTELAHLDLTANKITSLSPGLFEANTKLRTLILSRNSLQSVDAGCFTGLTQLGTLSLSFIQTPICVNEDAFKPLEQVTNLELDNSPWLAARIVTSSRLLSSLSGLRHFSLQRTDLTRLQPSFFTTYFPHVESVRLSGSAWVCDEDLVWLREWLMTSPLVTDLDRKSNKCAEPQSVARRRVVSLTSQEFTQRRRSHSRTRPRTAKNSKPSTVNLELDCSARLRSASDVAMTTEMLPNTTALSLGKKKSSTSSPFSASEAMSLRHNDNVGLVQIILIICTLTVTIALSAVIISVIFRLVRRRRCDVISSLKSMSPTESRVTMPPCGLENTASDGRRSRAASLSHINRGAGSRTTDCQRQAGGRSPVCDDVISRLVAEAEVDRCISYGGGTRITDEQWRMYTWEDT